MVKEVKSEKTIKSIRTTKQRFDRLWAPIVDDISIKYGVSLYATANLIGLDKFPVGWTMEEFKRQMEEPETYYAQAKNIRRIESVPEFGDQNPDGKRCFENAQQFRREVVRKIIFRMLKRSEVTAYATNDLGNTTGFTEEMRNSLKRLNIRQRTYKSLNKLSCL